MMINGVLLCIHVHVLWYFSSAATDTIKILHYSNEAETVTSLDDIHQVGAFVQITELYDMGDKIRMVVLGHRRFVKPHLIMSDIMYIYINLFFVTKGP